MPLVRSSHRQRVRRGCKSEHGVMRRRSSHRRSQLASATWADVLEAPVSLHRQQIMLLAIGLTAGWATLLFATVVSVG